MKIITIANQKGGTAKTTSTAALGVLLSRRGYRVHLIDADPQASLSQAFGISDSEDRFACSLIDGEELPVASHVDAAKIQILASPWSPDGSSWHLCRRDEIDAREESQIVLTAVWRKQPQVTGVLPSSTVTMPTGITCRLTKLGQDRKPSSN